MSVPKYIKETTKLQRVIRILSFIGIWIFTIFWISHVIIELPSLPLLILLFPEFYLLILCVISYYYFSIKIWKEKILLHENDIYETIAYRKKTSIKNIARVKKISVKTVIRIIERLIQQDKLFGTIKDGLFISEKTMTPICTICNKEIEDRVINMVLCPHCKRPFHKDHIIDYINEMEERCPNCKKTLKIGDIIK
ncbi:MAG: hypothetical protein ACTSQP_05015 [Promethearchaeota archaeon]